MKAGKAFRPPSLGGIDDRFQAPPSAASTVINMRWDPVGLWREAGGTSSLLPLDQQGDSLFVGVSSVQTMFYWVNGGRHHHVWEQLANGQLDLVTFDGAGGGSWTVLDEDRAHVQAPWPGTQYLAAAGWLWFLNGIDRWRRYDGEVVLPVGFDQAPPAPQVEATTRYDGVAMGLTGPAAIAHRRGIGEPGESWTRGYAVTWVNDLGSESPPSAVAYATGTNHADYPYYSNVVIDDAPAHVRGIRLWATRNVYGQTTPEAATLFLVAEWGSNQGLVYADGTPDALLGRLLDTSQLGLVPPGGRLLTMWQGHMWVALEHELAYSSPARLEQWPSANRRSVAGITAMLATRDALVVWTATSTMLVKGTPGAFVVQTLTTAVGTRAPNAVVEVPGERPRVFFLGDTGIVALEGTLDGGASAPGQPFAGRGLAKLWRAVNRQALARAWGVYHAADREVWWGIPTGGSGFPALGIVYHLDKNEWSVRSGYEFACAVSPPDGREVLFAGSYRADEGVLVYGRYSSNNGRSIDSVYESVWVSVATPWERATILHVAPLVVALGEEVSLSWRFDRLDRTTPDDTSKAAMHADNTPLSSWGDPSVWRDEVLVPLTWSVVGTGREFAWRLSASGAVSLCDVRLTIASSTPKVEVLDGSILGES